MCRPLPSAKKKRYSVSCGASALFHELSEGTHIGPGGRPSFRYVLYGESISRSLYVSAVFFSPRSAQQ